MLCTPSWVSLNFVGGGEEGHIGSHRQRSLDSERFPSGIFQGGDTLHLLVVSLDLLLLGSQRSPDFNFSTATRVLALFFYDLGGQ